MLEEATGLRLRLRQRQPLVATFCMIPCIESVELIALAGFDAVILDMEHGPMDIGTVRVLAVAAALRKMYCLVCVRFNDPTLIGAALDIGADGVLCLRSAALRRRAVQWLRRVSRRGVIVERILG